jgi:SAM-dependent methyltransferase
MSTERHLEGAFGRAAPIHYAWQTEGPYIAERERELVRGAFFPLGERVLDVGCGEGATLFHLGEPEGATGLDLFEDKVAFARERLPRCRFVAGSAYDLPFADGAFDHVVARDVVHHLDRPARFIEECARVLSPGGRLDLLEPSRSNPLVFAHALLIPVERGELRSTLGYLVGLVSSHFRVEGTERFQPLPLHRIVFHPDLGSRRLGESAAARFVVGAVESAARFLLPDALWAYLHVRAIKAD